MYQYRNTFICSVVLLFGIISNTGVLTFSNGGRIAGGKSTTIEEFPYQAYISHYNRTHCGGSIISKSTILTAAHCIASANQEKLEIRLGVTDISTDDGVHRKILKTIVHEDYNDQTIENDIALIILQDRLEFSASIHQASIPNQDEVIPAGTRAFVSGWGLEELNKPFPSILKYADVFVLEHNTCANAIEFIEITDKMICAARSDKGHPCNSDSGGPLTAYNDAGEPVIIGVVSFGKPCNVSGAPTVYTKVAAYHNWILKHMK